MNIKQFHQILMHSVKEAIAGKPDVAYYLLYRLEKLPNTDNAGCGCFPMFVEPKLISWKRFTSESGFSGANAILADIHTMEEALADFRVEVEPKCSFRRLPEYTAEMGSLFHKLR